MKNFIDKGWLAAALAGLAVLLAGPAATAQNNPAPSSGSMNVETTTFTLTQAGARPVMPAAPVSGAAIPAAAPRAVIVETSGTAEITPISGEGLRFNFRGVPLDTVLDYLSKAAGFIIIREATLQGRIDVVSHRSLNREEAVELLNTVLNQKGYAAIQNERTLRIMTLEDAKKRDLPVKIGNNAEQIKKSDAMVTQIIPVRHANATQLIQNLEALLPPYATISANESSNAVILTATQTDIRRMVEIITALDTSISAISTLKVFQLNYADATELAKLLGDLFKPTTSSSSSGGRGGGPPFGGPMAMMFGRREGGSRGGSSSGGDSAARQAAQQVTAVADTRTNALVVSAPAEVMATIEQLVTEIDTTAMPVCEIRVFTLRYSDATMMAQLVNSIYQPTTQSGSGSSQGGGGFSRRFMGFGGGSSPSPTSTAANGSRKSQESTVLAVPDVRTNSVIVNADKNIMEQIAPMIARLDLDPSKDKKVFIYPLKYADAEQTAGIIEDMFGDTTRGNRSSTNRSSGGVFGNSTSDSNSRNTSSNRSSGGSVPSGMSSR